MLCRRLSRSCVYNCINGSFPPLALFRCFNTTPLVTSIYFKRVWFYFSFPLQQVSKKWIFTFKVLLGLSVNMCQNAPPTHLLQEVVVRSPVMFVQMSQDAVVSTGLAEVSRCQHVHGLPFLRRIGWAVSGRLSRGVEQGDRPACVFIYNIFQTFCVFMLEVSLVVVFCKSAWMAVQIPITLVLNLALKL